MNATGSQPVKQHVEDVILLPPGSCDAAEERIEKAGTEYRGLDWFLCLRKYPGK